MSIQNAYYHFNTHPSLPVDPTDPDETFGLLVVKLDKVNITSRQVFILFTVDTTGSMSDYVNNTNTKIQYAIQTLKSIVKYVSTQELDIYLQINTFNEDVHTLIPPTKITADNSEQMLARIHSIDADGMTNIEAALKSATASILEYAESNPTHSCVHIFMTDGDPTCGETDANELVKYVSTDYLSINIGFGVDHNAKLLCKISNIVNGEYHFIDNVEHASIVYGESLHKVLYPCLHNVRITIENGLIYDWTKNKWSSAIYENTLISEITKYYHIKTKTIDDIAIALTAYNECFTENEQLYMNHVEQSISRLPDLIDVNGDILHDIDIVKFAFRQRILELLYDATHIVRDDVTTIKTQIREIFRQLRTYAQANDLIADGMIKQMMNDLYIAYWNIGNDTGEIYIYGRQSSQGNQYAHTPGNHQTHTYNNDNDFEIPPRPVLRRFNPFHRPARWNQRNVIDELTVDDSIDTEGITDREFSCYSTPGVRTTTNSIRGFDNENE